MHFSNEHFFPPFMHDRLSHLSTSIHPSSHAKPSKSKPNRHNQQALKSVLAQEAAVAAAVTSTELNVVLQCLITLYTCTHKCVHDLIHNTRSATHFHPLTFGFSHFFFWLWTYASVHARARISFERQIDVSVPFWCACTCPVIQWIRLHCRNFASKIK